MTTLNNAADHACQVASCPVRYVLSDDLTQLCADLAYSKGARCVACADLLHVPSVTLWLEWCNEPWQSALQRYGFPLIPGGWQWVGRRGALLQSSLNGRRGLLRTFWTGEREDDVLASSAEAHFDFDTPEGEEPESSNEPERLGTKVYDSARSGDDVLARCFRFRYERSWADYYGRAALPTWQREMIWRHTLGTIAIDVPMVLVFFLLLSTRSGLPQRAESFERLNRSRQKVGKVPLLTHLEVRAPILPEYRGNYGTYGTERESCRRGPRLHYVRGHLVRRANQLFWRVPHLRGSVRAGVMQARTVQWTFDDSYERLKVASARLAQSIPVVSRSSSH